MEGNDRKANLTERLTGICEDVLAGMERARRGDFEAFYCGDYIGIHAWFLKGSQRWQVGNIRRDIRTGRFVAHYSPCYRDYALADAGYDASHLPPWNEFTSALNETATRLNERTNPATSPEVGKENPNV